MTYHFKIHKQKKSYWGECIELNGCVSQGESLEELKNNLHEVLDLYFDEPPESKIIFPEPKKRVRQKNNVIKIILSPNIAFSYLLRKERLKSKLTQKDVAKKMGIKNIYSYQRLEKAKTSNPALKTINKIKEIFPNLNIEEVFSH